MTVHNSVRNTAFTLLELLMVIVIIGILTSRLLPAIAKAKPKVYQAQCMSNLRQIGIGFEMFANEHQQTFPMSISTAYGGSKEYAAGGNAFRHFAVLSNDLTTPKLLVCSSDDRTAADTWNTFDNSHLSFFVGIDAKPNYPNSLLAGDRNISQDSVVRSNLLQTNYSTSIGWTTNMHNNKGNVLFSGGYVSLLDTPKLQAAFSNVVNQ